MAKSRPPAIHNIGLTTLNTFGHGRHRTPPEACEELPARPGVYSIRAVHWANYAFPVEERYIPDFTGLDTSNHLPYKLHE